MWCAPGAHVRCHPTPVFHSHSSHPTQVPAVRSSQQRLTQTPEDTPAIIKLNENLAACRPDITSCACLLCKVCVLKIHVVPRGTY